MRVTLALLVLVSAPARALEDPDTEVARRHFERGRAAYDDQDYRRALDEFIAAERAKPAPAFDFNIARCYDRLEDYPKAIDHYQLYVQGKPSASDAAEVRGRIAALERRVEEVASARTAGTPATAKPPAAKPPPELDKL